MPGRQRQRWHLLSWCQAKTCIYIQGCPVYTRASKSKRNYVVQFKGRQRLRKIRISTWWFCYIMSWRGVVVHCHRHTLARMAPCRPKPPVYLPTVPFDQCCIVQYSPFLDTEEVVAKRDIAVDTWIDSSAPLWTVEKHRCRDDLQNELVRAFDAYSEQHESEVAYSENLMPRFHPPMSRAYWIEQIYRTNSWQSCWDARYTVTSMPNGSKFNHSCDSNLHVHVDHTQFRVRALRNISEGEALTVSYMDNRRIQETLDERREYLQYWNFHCMCTRCEIEETLMSIIDQLELEDQPRHRASLPAHVR